MKFFFKKYNIRDKKAWISFLVLSISILVFFISLVFVPRVHAAATYYAIADGNWNVNTTWSLSSKGSAVGVGVWPVAGDTVYIGESDQARAVTIPSGYSAACASVAIGISSQNKANSLTLADGTALLAVSGNIDINRPSGGNTNGLNVNAGTVSVGGNITLAGTNTGTNRIAQIAITTGTMTVSGNLVFITGSSASNLLTMSGGAGTFNLAGDFTATDGALAAGVTSTFNFNGTAAQTIPMGVSSIVYNNLNINNTNVSGAALNAAITSAHVTGNLSVQSGTFANGGFATALAVNKSISVSNGAIFNLSDTSTMTTVSGTGTKTFGATSTVNYSGTVQTVSQETYGNLTFSGSGNKTTVSGTTTVAGNWDVTSAMALLSANNTNMTVTGNISGNGAIASGSGTITIAGNWTNNGTFIPGIGTVNFNGGGTQTIPALNFNNLTSSSTGARTLASSGTIGIAGAFTPSSNSYTITGSTIEFNGSSVQTTGGTPFPTFNNLTINNSAGVAMAQTQAVNGTLVLTSGTLSVAANTLTISGGSPTRTSGGIDASNASATLAFTNSSAITLPASTFSVAVNNLIINGAGGVTASSDFTINGVLNLHSANPSSSKGSLDMGANTLTMGASATTTGIWDVTGIVKRTTLVAAVTYTFGNQYTSINFQNTGTLPTDISVKTTLGVAPSWKTAAIQRTYETVRTGGVNSFAMINLHYLDSELNGNTENTLVKWACNTPFTPGTAIEYGRSNYNTTNNWVGSADYDVSLFPTSFNQRIGTLTNSVLTSATWNGSVSTVWTNPSNWTPSGVPADLADAVIPDASTTAFDPTLPASIGALSRLTIQSGGILNGPTAAGTFTLSGGNGAWSNNGGTFNPGTVSTIAFSNADATMSGATDFYNVTINSGAGLEMAISSTIRITGAMTNSGTWRAAQSGSTTVEYNGAAQTVLNPNGVTLGYDNLILSGSGAKAVSVAALSVGGNFTMSGSATVTANAVINTTGNFTVGPSNTYTMGAFSDSIGGNLVNSGTFTGSGGTITLGGSLTNNNTFTATGSTISEGGDFTNNGTFTATGSNITLNGTSSQSIGGTSLTTFDNLTINNATGVTLNGASPEVSGALTLASGNITTGANNIYINSTGSVSRTSGHVIGNFKKFIASGVTSKTFEIGDASNYIPASISFGNVTVAGDLTVSTTTGDHPNIGSSTLNNLKTANRYWTTTNSGITFNNYSAVFNFINPGDLDGGATPANFIVGKYNSGWTYPTVGTKTSTSTQTTGLTSFSDFQLGEANTVPNAPILVSPGSGSYTNSTTPILSANYSDPGVGGNGTTNYRIATSALNCLAGTVVASGTSASVSNPNNTTWTPGSSIGSDATYYWCAQNNNGALTSSWISMGNFILDTTGPTLIFTDNVAVGPVISDTVSVTWGDASVKKWKYNINTSCSTNTGDYSQNDADSMDQTTQTNNTNYICLYAEDALGNKSTLVSANPINIDATAPSGGSITYIDGYYTISLVALTVADGIDGESGINTLSRIVQRKSATLSAGTCGSYGSFATITPSGAYPSFTDNTGVSGNCYLYQYLVSDNVGNQSTYVSSSIVKLDTGIPTTPGVPITTTPTSSTTQIWNWTAATDVVSGIVSYAWRTTGSLISSGISFTNSVVTNLTQGVYNLFVSATNGAGVSGSESSSSLIVDTTDPASAISTPSDNSYSASTTVVLTGTSVDPNLSTTTISMDGSSFVPTGGTAAAWTYSAIGLSQGVHTFQSKATDLAGNTGVSSTVHVIVDTNVPVISLTAPATNAYINSITASSAVNYTLSEAIASGTIVMTRIGGTPDGSHTCTLKGTALNAGAHTAFDMSDTTNLCTVAQSLVDGAIYTFVFNSTDLATNPATPVTNTGITFDASAPTLTITTIPISPSSTKTALIVTFQFSEDVTGFSAADITLNFAAAGAGMVDGATFATIDANTYTLTLNTGNDATDRAALTSGQAIVALVDMTGLTDMALNPGMGTTTKTWTYLPASTTTPSLGAAASFAILASTFTRNSGLTTVTGDLGYTTLSGSGSHTVVNGTDYGSSAPYATAGADQTTALTNLNGQACVSLGSDVVLSGTYTPGCYSSSGSMDIVATTTVTLDGAGTYIFRPVGALTTGADSIIALTNGANASDIFWTPSAATTLGANTTFKGNIIDNAGITIGSTTSLTGRALAFGGTVIFDTDNVIVPAPVLAFTNNVEVGPVTSDTITATWGAALIKKWDYDADGVCSTTAGDYTKTDADSINQTTETNNAKYICLYGEDALGNKSTLASINAINIDLTDLAIMITAPTKLSNIIIGDTIIHATSNNTINFTNVTVDAATTAGYANFNCSQTNSETIDCTIDIVSSGDLIIKAIDNAVNVITQPENNYIIDIITPVITLLGDATVDLTVGDSYTDAGATALDNIDGNLTTSIITAGLPIDTSIVGTFTIHYNVSDTATNPAVEVTRTVIVSAVSVPATTSHHHAVTVTTPLLSPAVSNSPVPTINTSIPAPDSTPKGITELTTLQPPNTTASLNLFDVISTPVQSSAQTQRNVILFVILSAATVTLLMLSTIFVTQWVRIRKVERKIQEEMMYKIEGNQNEII